MPRGGYRPGYGFQKGNLYAVKHGRYSEKFQELRKLAPNGFFILNKRTGVFEFVEGKRGVKNADA